MRVNTSNPDFKPFGPGRWTWDRTVLSDYGARVQALALEREAAGATAEDTGLPSPDECHQTAA
jgi:hypothetical protein